jgi:hypothetical protein
MAMSILRRAAFPDHDRKMKNWKDEIARGVPAIFFWEIGAFRGRNPRTKFSAG